MAGGHRSVQRDRRLRGPDAARNGGAWTPTIADGAHALGANLHPRSRHRRTGSASGPLDAAGQLEPVGRGRRAESDPPVDDRSSSVARSRSWRARLDAPPPTDDAHRIEPAGREHQHDVHRPCDRRRRRHERPAAAGPRSTSTASTVKTINLESTSSRSRRSSWRGRSRAAARTRSRSRVRRDGHVSARPA